MRFFSRVLAKIVVIFILVILIFINSDFRDFATRCNSKNNNDNKNALSGIMANDLKFPSINSVGNNNILSIQLQVLQRFGPLLPTF